MISSKTICSITDRQTDKIFTEQMIIYEGNLHKKIGAISQLGADKITLPHNTWLTGRWTYGQTDIRTDSQTDGHLLLQNSFATKKIRTDKQEKHLEHKKEQNLSVCLSIRLRLQILVAPEPIRLTNFRIINHGHAIIWVLSTSKHPLEIAPSKKEINRPTTIIWNLAA